MEWTVLDTWIAVTGALAAAACALPGCFLVLRRQSLLGDAISHAVLPGLAGAFLLTGSREVVPMFAGAVAVGVLTAWLVRVLGRGAKLEESAAMGVVFTSLFALGLLMIRLAADRVDLDPGCVLYGSLELSPFDTVTIAGHELPRAAVMGAGMLLLDGLIILALFKELALLSFDAATARAQGLPTEALHFLLMTMVAATCVAAFESVGSILVVAMLIVPASAAHLLTNRLSTMILLSLVLAVLSAFLGQAGAIWVPGLFGKGATSTSGMIAVASGALLLAAALLSPHHGLIARVVSRWLLSLRIAREDLLASLYRQGEVARQLRAADDMHPELPRSGVWPWAARTQLRLVGAVEMIPSGGWGLSETGQRLARAVIRSHRLWEGYLTDQGGLAPAAVHRPAERLEHFTDPELLGRLESSTGSPEQDPHRRPIPKP